MFVTPVSSVGTVTAVWLDNPTAVLLISVADNIFSPFQSLQKETGPPSPITNKKRGAFPRFKAADASKSALTSLSAEYHVWNCNNSMPAIFHGVLTKF